MTDRSPWFDAQRAVVREALGLGRARAIAVAVADEPPAHMLADEVAAAKAPFDRALLVVDALVAVAEAAENLIDRTVPDLMEVGRRELRLSQALHAARRAANSQSVPRP